MLLPFPTCEEWWGALRGKLVAEAQTQASGGALQGSWFSQMATNVMGALGVSSVARYEDLLIEQAAGELVSTASSRLDHEMGSVAGSITGWSMGGLVKGVFTGETLDRARGLAMSGGLASEQFSFAMKMPLVMKAAPLVQSILILVVIALVPVVMVVGRYSLGTLLACGIGYFTVRFWTFLWALASWADEMLISMFASNQAMVVGGSFGPNDQALTYARYAMEMSSYQMSSVIQLTTAALFIGMPALFSMLLGWAGVIGISGLNEGMKAMSASTENAGNRADQGARAVVGATAAMVAAPTVGGGGVAGALAGAAARSTSDVVKK